jgi:hypothetical protein
MHKILSAILLAVLLLIGCNKPSNKSEVTVSLASPNDPLHAKLQELSGGGATNCGVLTSQAEADLTTASKCAMDAAKAKEPFHVEYQMPGMNVAMAGNSQGKLYSVQSQTGGAGITVTDCPAELRVAPSGRVTCYAPGTFPMGGATHGTTDMGMGGAMPPGHPSVQKPTAPAKP